MKKSLVLLTFIVLSSVSFAQVTKYTSVTYEYGEKATVTALHTELTSPLVEIRHRYVTNIGTEGKETWSTEKLPVRHWPKLEKLSLNQVDIFGPGIHEIVYFKPYELPPAELIGYGEIIWRQRVYVPFNKPSNAEEIARKYAPFVQFNIEEYYFPVSINQLMFYGSDSNATITVENIDGDDPGKIGAGLDLQEFLSHNGNPKYRLIFGHHETTCNWSIPYICSPLYLRNLTGSIEEPTMYWEASEEGNTLYLSYYMFYGFDPKAGSAADPAFAAHAFDRESFTITLEKGVNGDYIPQFITYAGHGAANKMNFLGCDSITECEHAKKEIIGDDKLRTFTGKTTLAWEYANKIGDKPVVYIAKGSHAIYPTFGWYEVFSVNEKAGDSNRATMIHPERFQLYEMNFNLLGPLAFSGTWVEAPGLLKRFDSRFPPFINRTPHSLWLSERDLTFDKCFQVDSNDCDGNKEEIKQYFEQYEPIEYGLLAHYTFDGNTNDTSGNEKHLVYHDALTFIDGAAVFDSAADTLIGDPVLNRDSSVTISALTSPSQVTGSHMIAIERRADGRDACGRNSAGNFALMIYQNGQFSFEAATFIDGVCNQRRLFDPGSITPNHIYRVTGVYDRENGKLRIYRNGELKNEMNVGFELRTEPDAIFRVGSNNNNKQPFLGKMHDLKIWSRVLSDEEVADL